MSKPNYLWRVWLRLNLLTKDVVDGYIAEVQLTGNKAKRNEDIAKRIGKEGSEIKFDTLVYILNQRDRIIREMVQEGYSVLTGCSHYAPRLSGTWIGSKAKFDPAVHKITLDIVPSAEMRAALKEVSAEVLGLKADGAYIGLVTDTATGLTDGSITLGDDICIEGDKLKIAPDGEAGLGVFFVNADGEAIPVTRRLTQNDPKKLIARVPNLPSGQYTVRVVTRFSNSVVSLKEPRVIEYSKLLIV